MTAWSCHSMQKYVSEKRGHAQQIFSLPTVNKICPWIYSSCQCGINEFWVWVTLGSTHNEVGSWAAFSAAMHPDQAQPQWEEFPYRSVVSETSGKFSSSLMLALENAQCFDFDNVMSASSSAYTGLWLWHRKSQSSCQGMPHSRVSPPGACCFTKKLESPPCCSLCVHDQVSICVGQKITLRSHSGTIYLVDFYFLVFSLEKFS